ncbi:MAG: apolipoprotein and lipocalin family protein [Campylobacterota bacterium]|nr:apolipoprotein and lipocalin family protein [Campylobacterota bacterium]
MRAIIFIAMFLLAGCVERPEKVVPVKNFELSRYLGTWYEIARLDHSFERGLEQISATYGMREDGGVRVINRGFDTESKQWKEAEGKAYFVQTPDVGFLKVSFFGPFYGSYIVFDLDHEQYSLISGPNLSYLWILSRRPQMDEATKKRLIQKAKDAGFDTNRLIFVKHTDTNQSVSINK